MPHPIFKESLVAIDAREHVVSERDTSETLLPRVAFFSFFFALHLLTYASS